MYVFTFGLNDALFKIISSVIAFKVTEFAIFIPEKLISINNSVQFYLTESQSFTINIKPKSQIH